LYLNPGLLQQLQKDRQFDHWVSDHIIQPEYSPNTGRSQPPNWLDLQEFFREENASVNIMQNQRRNLGNQFGKRLESFALCYSQRFHWRIFEENHTVLWFSKYMQKMRNKKTQVYSRIAFCRKETLG
jgi:hypothetical protein